MPRVINSEEQLTSVLDKMPQWPGLPDGFCAIITRPRKITLEYEEVVVMGWLRKNSVAFPPGMLFDADGNALGISFHAGDFIDGYENFQKLEFHVQQRIPKG